jgi:general secretion pathway protein E
MNMGIEPFLLCSSVIVVIGQRLLRRVCKQCRDEYLVPEELAVRVGLRKITKEKEIKVYRGKGCPACLNTGYRGRVGISEVLILSSDVKEMILQRKGESRIKEAGRKEGMQTMREDGLQKVLRGFTTLEEVLRVTSPDEEMK